MNKSHDIFEVLVVRLKEYMAKTGADTSVVGVSGGIDSALVLAIAARALGPARVSAIFMPSTVTPQQDRIDAQAACTFANVTLIETDIMPIVSAVYAAASWKLNELAQQNASARARMLMLYAFANSHDARVLGTGNRSELLVGYFTKYGDGGVDVLPIGGLYKTQVQALARAIGIPQSILTKAPSARLIPGQTDEAELGMTYEKLDEILEALVQDNTALLATYNKATVARVRSLIDTSEHKRLLPYIIPHE